MLSSAAFGRVYAPETRQNHKGKPGVFCFYLARTWGPRRATTIQVEVSDTGGNTAVYTTQVGTADIRV